MSDIAETLQRLSTDSPDLHPELQDAILEALDEIMRLRAQLRATDRRLKAAQRQIGLDTFGIGDEETRNS